MFQKSSISLDIELTLLELKKFQSQKEKIYQEEIKFLKENKIDLLISDSASFPFLFANQLGIKSIFIGNFTWDFIYSRLVAKFSIGAI